MLVFVWVLVSTRRIQARFFSKRKWVWSSTRWTTNDWLWVVSARLVLGDYFKRMPVY
jgi:hypothetical protein